MGKKASYEIKSEFAENAGNPKSVSLQTDTSLPDKNQSGWKWEGLSKVF